MREVKDGEAVLFGGHVVQCNSLEDGDVELLVLPTGGGHVHVRFAKEPYACTLFLADGSRKGIHLADTDDWGNIQPCTYDDFARWGSSSGERVYRDDMIGWGNDADGHIPIEKVHDARGRPIPLRRFWHDVADLMAYHADN